MLPTIVVQMQRDEMFTSDLQRFYRIADDVAMPHINADANIRIAQFVHKFNKASWFTGITARGVFQRERNFLWRGILSDCVQVIQKSLALRRMK